MTPDKSRIKFYFDYISSNAYLAWRELPKLASKYDAEVEPVPVLFAGLLEAHGQLGPAEVPPKAYWTWKNNLRKAVLLGIPLNQPAFHPFNPLLALRASSIPADRAKRATLIDGLFNAVWVHGLHVSEASVVAKIGSEAGLDGPRLVAEAQNEESKVRLRAQTDEAISRGVFGIPSMGVGDELFWGYDDFPYLELLLAGKDPLDPEKIRNSRETFQASSVRKRFKPPGGNV